MQVKEAMESVQKPFQVIVNVLKDTQIPAVHVRLISELFEEAKKKLDAFPEFTKNERRAAKMENHSNMLLMKSAKDLFRLIFGNFWNIYWIFRNEMFF